MTGGPPKGPPGDGRAVATGEGPSEKGSEPLYVNNFPKHEAEETLQERFSEKAEDYNRSQQFKSISYFLD